MNERIKELAEQAGVISGFKDLHPDMIKFAELIRQDEAKACAEHYLGIMRDAVEKARQDERYACAKIADDLERKQYEAIGDPRHPEFKSLIGNAIRARSKE